MAALTSQQKCLTRDPLTAWKRLFNDNVNSLTGLDYKNSVGFGARRDEFNKQDKFLEQHNHKLEPVLHPERTYESSSNKNSVKKEQWHSKSNNNYASECRIEIICQDYSLKKTNQTECKNSDPFFESFGKGKDQTRAICRHGEAQAADQTEVGGDSHFKNIINNGLVFDDRNKPTTISLFSFVEHRLSGRYIFCYSMLDSNGSKVILKIENVKKIREKAKMRIHIAIFSNQIEGTHDCIKPKTQEYTRALCDAGRRNDGLEEKHLFRVSVLRNAGPWYNSINDYRANSLKQISTSGFPPSDIDQIPDFTTCLQNSSSKQQGNRLTGVSKSTCTGCTIGEDSDKIPRKLISSSIQPKSLTRNPNTVWKKLFDDNVNSLVRNVSDSKMESNHIREPRDENVTYMRGMSSKNCPMCETGKFYHMPSHRHLDKYCLPFNSRMSLKGNTDSSDKSYSIGFNHMLLTNSTLGLRRGDSRVNELLSTKHTIMHSKDKTFQENDIGSQGDNTEKLRDLQIVTTISFTEHCLSGHVIFNSFNMNRKLRNLDNLVYLGNVNQLEYLQKYWRELSKRSKFTNSSNVTSYGNPYRLCSINQLRDLNSVCRNWENSKPFYPSFDTLNKPKCNRKKETKSKNAIVSNAITDTNDLGASGDVWNNNFCSSVTGCSISFKKTMVEETLENTENSIDTKAGGDYVSRNKQNVEVEKCKESFDEIIHVSKNQYNYARSQELDNKAENRKRTSLSRETRCQEGKTVKNLIHTKNSSRDALKLDPFEKGSITSHCDFALDFRKALVFSQSKSRNESQDSKNSVHMGFEDSYDRKKTICISDQTESRSRNDLSNKFDLSTDLCISLPKMHHKEMNEVRISNQEIKDKHSHVNNDHFKVPQNGLQDHSVPSSYFKLPNDMLQEFEGFKQTGKGKSMMTASSGASFEFVESKERKECVTKRDTDLLKIESHSLIEGKDFVGARKFQNSSFSIELNQPQSGKETKNSKVHLNNTYSKNDSETTAKKETTSPTTKKHKRHVPLINPFDKDTFEDSTDSLLGMAFNTQITKNNQTLSSYFSHQGEHKEEKLPSHENKSLRIENSEISKLPILPDDNTLIHISLGADKELTEEGNSAVLMRGQSQVPPEEISAINCQESNCQSVDVLNESSIECLLEQLIQRGTIKNAFVMDVQGSVLARSRDSSVRDSTAKCFYDSLRGHYNGLMKIDDGNGNSFTCFKSVDGDMFVGTSEKLVTVCRGSTHAIVVGFAQRDASGSCIKEMTELSNVLDKRGL